VNNFLITAKNNTMSNNRTITHYRDSRGRIVPVENTKEKRSGGMARFLGGVVATLVFGLALSSILLYTAMQTSAQNYAKIEQIERQNMQKDAEIRQIKADLDAKNGAKSTQNDAKATGENIDNNERI
jgi:hypothetical protein